MSYTHIKQTPEARTNNVLGYETQGSRVRKLRNRKYTSGRQITFQSDNLLGTISHTK